MAEAAAARHPAPARRGRPRFGVLDRYILRGAAVRFALILPPICLAMMLERALRLVQEMAVTGADIAYLPALLLGLAPYYLDLALPAAFMAAVMLLVARLDEDVELEAMLASGVSLTRIAAPLIGMGLAVGALGLLNSGWLEPIGRHEFRSLRIEALNAGELARLQPGALYQPGGEVAVTFDRGNPDGGAAGLFLWQRQPDGQELIVTAASGRVGFVPRGRLFGVDFGEGRYVLRRPGETTPDLVAFGALDFRESLRLRDPRGRRGADPNEMTLPELGAALHGAASASPPHALAAEMYSRIAWSALVPLIPLLVLPLAFATKRGRRTLGLVLAGALLAFFQHSINLGRQLAFAGAVDPRAGVFGAALLGAAIVGLVFWSGRKLPSHSPLNSALTWIGGRLPRRAQHAAAMRSPAGHVLPAYLAWQLGRATLIALAAVVALLQMVDLFGRGDEFVERGMGAADVARYALLRLAPTMQIAIPVAGLAGAMLVFTALARSHEMSAIRAAGVSSWRILAMALPVPVLLGVALFVLAEFVSPASQLRFTAWWQATAPSAVEAPLPRWFRIGGDIVRAGEASADGRRLANVEIFGRDASGLIASHTVAARAEPGTRGWRLSEVSVMRFGDYGIARARQAEAAWATPLRPVDVRAFFASPRPISASAARRSLDARAPADQGSAPYAVRLYRTLAEPLAPLVMLMLALPLALASPRRGTHWPALLYAGVGGLAYLVADGVLTAAAQVGYLPIPLGTWGAPLLFGLTAVTVLLYAER